MKARFDTNILIDYLNGVSAARDEIAAIADEQAPAWGSDGEKGQGGLGHESGHFCF